MKKRPSPTDSDSDSERSGNTRRPIGRIVAIHSSVRRGRFPNCRTLAEEIGVTQKTIQRDVTFMQRELGLPLAYDEFRHGYHYTAPVSDFPLLCHGVEDVVALFLARRALEPLRGTPFEASLRDAFRKMATAVPGGISFRWTDLEEAFSVRESGAVPADVRLFEKIARAVLESCELRFRYRKLDGDDWEPRRVRPFHLAESDGGWYLIGHDPDRQARRTFAVQRMKEVRTGPKGGFLRPADFSPTDHLGGSFGVWNNPGNGTTRHRIRLRFTGWAARVVSERRWHPSQQIRWLGKKEDRLEMILDLSGFEEISRWIQSWGPQVEVLEPAALRESIAANLAKTRELYAKAK